MINRSPLRTLAILASVSSLAGCQADARYAAGRDVRAFLQAARDGDGAALARHVDRAQVARNVRAQLPASVSDQAVAEMTDRILRPSSFTVDIIDGGNGARLPSALTLAIALKSAGKGRFCLPPGPKQFQCALTFAKEGNGWKLVGLNAARFARVAPPAA